MINGKKIALIILSTVLALLPGTAMSTTKISCGNSAISTRSPVFRQPKLICWKHENRAIRYHYVHAENPGRTYAFVGLANATKDSWMRYQPRVKTIVRTVAPTTYARSRGWSEDRDIKTKYPTKASYAEFQSKGQNCFGFVQYISRKNAGFKIFAVRNQLRTGNNSIQA